MTRSRPALAFAVMTALAALASPGVVEAQRGLGQMQSDDEPVREVPGLDQVDVEEHLGDELPLDLTFTNHEGEKVQLAEFFDGDRPVLLTFNYYTCPVLCSMVLEATAKAMKDVPWTAGREFEIVTISIDPRDTPERAAKKRAEMLRKYGKSDEGWHFLVGDEENIEKATSAAGIEYFYNGAQEQYAHPAVIQFVTPGAKFARYLYGLQYDSNDARLALFESAKGNTLSTVEKVVISCYRYDPDEGGYTLLGWRIMQFGAGATAVAIGAVLFVLWRRERRKDKKRRAQVREQGEGPVDGTGRQTAHG